MEERRGGLRGDLNGGDFETEIDRENGRERRWSELLSVEMRE
jgi:hypothetical protein